MESLKLRFRTTPWPFSLSPRTESQTFCRRSVAVRVAGEKTISPKQSSLRVRSIDRSSPGVCKNGSRNGTRGNGAEETGATVEENFEGGNDRRRCSRTNDGEPFGSDLREREPLRVIGSLERDSWIPKRVPMQTRKIGNVSVAALRHDALAFSARTVNGHCLCTTAKLHRRRELQTKIES